MESDNPWDWVAEEPPPIDVSAERVTAVLVTRQSGRWLAQTLASLATLSIAPDRLLAIDNESTDASTDLLADAVDDGVVDAAFTGSESFGFGAAIRAALDADNEDADDEDADGEDADHADAGEPVERDPEHDWLWLLHDDITVAPDSLRRLLELAVTEPQARLIGPKLLQPSRGRQPERILELGRSIANSGRRVSSTEPGEVDQGQRDEPAEVLGLSSCGLLIRADVWDELGGFDEALPLFRDGEDLGWRANRCGYRVFTCPVAEIHHRQVGQAGVRDGALTGSDARGFDRLMAMRTVAANHTGAAAAWIWVRLVLGGIARAVGLALGKAGRASLGELRAVRSFVGSGAELRDMRGRRARLTYTEEGERRAQGLRPGWWAGPQLVGENVAGAIGDGLRAWRGEEAPEISIDELAGDSDFDGVEDVHRRWWHSPTLVGLALSVLGAVVASRQLLTGGGLTASLLLSAPESLGSAYAAYVEPIAGLPGAWSAPWVGLTALGSTLAFGQPQWWLTVLVCGSVPLAYLSAVLASRRLLPPGWISVLLCLLYALTPQLLGAFGRGDLQVLGLAVCVPLTAWAMAQFWTSEHRWRPGFQVALASVFVVSLLPAASLLIGLLVLAGAALRRDRWWPGLLAIGGVWLANFPWVPTLLAHPGRLLTGPDPTLAPNVAGSTVELLIGRTPGVGLPPLLLSVGVFGLCWVGGLAALALRPRDPAILAAVSSAVLALAAATVSLHVVVAVSPAGDLVRPGAAGWLLIAAVSLLIALAKGVAAATGAPSADAPRAVVRGVGVAISAILAIAVLGGGAFWLSGVSTTKSDAALAAETLEPGATVAPKEIALLHRTAQDQLPPFVAKAGQEPARLRALVVDLTAETRWSLVEGGATTLGDGERGFALGGSPAAERQVSEGVARIASASTDAALAADLANLGVGFLKVEGATDRQVTGLENSPGLGVGIADRGAMLWTVSPTRARLVLVDGQDRQPVTDQVPDASGPRTLLLGEPMDKHWTARLNGQKLESIESGWQQGFAVPAGGGALEVAYSAPVRGWLAGLQLLALAALIVGATPGVRREVARPEPAVARRGRSIR